MSGTPQAEVKVAENLDERASGADARDRILDAAEARLLELGPRGLVLAAVAEDAGVSKGGLLYHFASKDALVEGLRDRMLASFERLLGAHAGRDEEPGGFCRAYLASTVRGDGTAADSSAQVMAGLLALVGNDPQKLAPLRECFGRWHRRIEADGIDPVLASIVRLAADGLWLSSLLGLPGAEPALARRVVGALARMTGED